MSDWYDKALNEFIREGSVDSEVKTTDFIKVYKYLSSVGLVDYDIEKEYLYETYVDSEAN